MKDKVTLTIKYRKDKHGMMSQTSLGGKWNSDLARIAIERIVREVDKKHPLVEWWEMLWRRV